MSCILKHPGKAGWDREKGQISGGKKYPGSRMTLPRCKVPSISSRNGKAQLDSSLYDTIIFNSVPGGAGEIKGHHKPNQLQMVFHQLIIKEIMGSCHYQGTSTSLLALSFTMSPVNEIQKWVQKNPNPTSYLCHETTQNIYSCAGSAMLRNSSMDPSGYSCVQRHNFSQHS